MSKKRIRNPEAYTAARQREIDERNERIQQAAEEIHDIVLERALNNQTFDGIDLASVAWDLRCAGILGQRDRKKDPNDKYNSIAKAALWQAIEDEFVIRVKHEGWIEIKPSYINTLPFRTIRKLEDKTDRILIDLNSRDTIDEICDMLSRRYIHTKGSTTHKSELALH